MRLLIVVGIFVVASMSTLAWLLSFLSMVCGQP